MAEIQRPDCVEDEHLEFLNDLRESATRNIAASFIDLSEQYPDLGRANAKIVARYWMKTFKG